MPETRGGVGKRKRFGCRYDPVQTRIIIEKRDGGEHEFPVQEIERILKRLYASFGDRFFPLANNVQKLHDGSEQLGLGRIILEQRPGDVYHAQGSSYLGVVLEACGYFEWNGRRRGIAWRLVDRDFETEAIVAKLQTAATMP